MKKTLAICFIFLFSLQSLETFSHKIEVSLNTMRNQTFEAIPNYLGEPFLVSHLVADLDENTSEIGLAISYDNKNWEVVDRESLSKLPRGSYENTSIHFEVAALEEILKKMRTKEIYIKTFAVKGNQTKDISRYTFHRSRIKAWYKNTKR